MSLFGTGRRDGLLAVLLLLVLSLAMYSPGLFLGQSRSVAIGKAANQQLEANTNRETLVPAMQLAGATARQGEAPLWNRSFRLGEPFFSSGAPLLYPPFWLLMLRGGNGLLELVLCMHSFLACMFMYRFLRCLPLSRYSAFLGGAMYGLGWFLASQMDRLPHAAAAALTPLALEMTWRTVVHARRNNYALLWALSICLLFATGGTSTACLATILCLALFAFGQLALDYEDRAQSMRAASIGGIVAILITSPLWIYFLTHLGTHSQAADPSHNHLQLMGLLGVLGPNLYGDLNGIAPMALREVNPGADPMELALFPGSLALFLVVLGLLRPKRTAHGLFWILVGGLGLLLSLDSPIAEAIFGIFPWAISNPGSALFLVNVAFVVLASVALESFFEAPLARRFAAPVASIFAIASCLALFVAGFILPDLGRQMVTAITQNTIAGEIQESLHHLRLAMLQPILFVIAIAALFFAWRRMGIIRFKVALATLAIADLLLITTMQIPREANVGQSETASAMAPKDAGRVVTTDRHKRHNNQALLQDGLQVINTPASKILHRTEVFLSMVDASMVRVGSRSLVAPLLASPILSDPLLRLVGVGVGISQDGQMVEGFSPLVATPGATGPAGNVAEFQVHVRNEKAQRFRILFQTIAAKDQQEASRLLERHAAQVEETIILEQAPADFVSKRPAAPPELQVIEDSANRLQLQVDMGQGRGFLLVADAYAPGWQATVDGESTNILAADVALRAIPVAEGQHQIVFAYRPLWWRLGATLASLGLMLALVWMLNGWLVKRRRKNALI